MQHPAATQPRPWLHRLLPPMMALGLFFLGMTTLAQDSNPFNSSRNTFTSTSFLPIDQAFQLRVYSDNDHLWLHWDAAPGYYLYQERFGLVDAATRQPLDIELRFHSDPATIHDDFFERDMAVYYHEALISLPLESTRELIAFGITSQGCADAGLCYEPQTHFVSLEGGQPQLQLDSASALANDPPGSDAIGLSGWTTMLGLALLGGMVLNLMPCVFPVLSIKVMHFATQHQSRPGRYWHGIAYTAGIVVMFAAFAAALYGFRATGELAGWGFQLQSPLFIAYLAYLFTALGLSLSGLLLIGGSLMNLGQGQLSDSQGLGSSFLTGALAAVVASPCTAPFMGVALGFAITQPIASGMLVFVALGVGMALPLLLLTWWPGLAERMPAPGQWMESFKQLLAFPLYLTVVWLLWILGRQTNSDYLALIIAGLVGIAFASWLWQRQRISGKRLTGALAILTALGTLALPFAGDRNTADPTTTSGYTPERLADLLANDQAVFVNLTADWCITCLANERTVLETERFQTFLKDQGITYLKGDWTNGDPAITLLLEEYDRTGVPLYLYYPARQREPVILPQLLRFSQTQSIIATFSDNRDS